MLDSPEIRADDDLRPSSPSSSFSSIGAGLANLGNTCFLNAVLQCFTHTVPLVESLRTCAHATPCRGDGEGFCAFCALLEHIELSLSCSRRIVSPSKLVENLSYLSSSFQRFQQEDAHEFLQCMLDKLEGCVESKSQEKPSCSQEGNFVKNIFGGRLRSRLRCCHCGHSSDTLEPLVDLSLEIEGVDALSPALQSFTRVEKIGDAETEFTCENCKEKVSVEKQLTIDQAPSVAVLHLKRFKNDGYYVEKINEHVKYPLELDLQPFTSNPHDKNNELRYDLYAVLVHIGVSSWSGHYFCFIRSSPDSWHMLDDTQVRRVSEEFVLDQEAYILFYKRQGSPWFSSLMETYEKCVDFENTSPRSVLDDMKGVAVPSVSGDGSSCSEVDDAMDAPSTPPPTFSGPDILPRESTEFGMDHTAEKENNKIPHGHLRTPASEQRNYEVPGGHSRMLAAKQGNYEIAHGHLRTPGAEKGNYEIPRGHLRTQDWKKPAKSVVDGSMDGKSKQQLSKLLRGMPQSRRHQFLGCMSSRGCQSYGVVGQKKRRRLSEMDSASRHSDETHRHLYCNNSQAVHSSKDSDNLIVQFNSV